MRLDEFTTAYIECMLWSTNDESTPEGGEPFDENYSVDDIDSKSLVNIVNDCKAFQEKHANDILPENYSGDLPSITRGHAGHDFGLTRNHHGAGFWDGDWKEPAASRMNATSKEMGEVYLEVGEDNKIYTS